MSSSRMRQAAAKHFGVQDIVNRNCHRLVLSGELDLASAGDLEAVILRICGNGDALVLDLSRLTFMDSSGLRLILLAGSLCREHEREFAVVPGQQNIAHLLEISGTLGQVPLLRPAETASARPVVDTRGQLLTTN
jgi:anti-sigma B factor antagonist